MNTSTYRLVEHEDGYIVYKGDEIYETKLYTNIFVYDKGLGEAVVRKLNEGKPTLVNRYLCKFSREELLDIIRQLQKHDALEQWGLRGGTNDFLKCESLFSDRHIRQLIEGYTELGSLAVVAELGMVDVYEAYDIEYGGCQFEYFYNMEEKIREEEGREVNFDEEFAQQVEERYNACFLPPFEGYAYYEDEISKARKRFYEKVCKLLYSSNR